MANAGRPNSGGSQFFLNVANNSNLDWFSPGASKHPVFGKIVSGYDVAVAISKVPTRGHRPIMPIKMNSIQIREPELEEEDVALPEAEKDADVLRRASIERVLKGCVYHGTVEDIEQGKDSGERLYLIRYTDGDTEHLTADQVRQWSRTADGSWRRRLSQKETCASGRLVTSAAPSNHFTSTLSTSSWTPVPLSMLWSGSWPSRQLLVSILSNRYKNGSRRWTAGAKRDSTSSKRDRPLQEVPSSQ